MKNRKSRYAGWMVGAFLALNGFMLAAPAEAASVYNCSVSGSICVVKVEEGIIGDRVKVMDEKARVIAYGRITKRRGYYAQVAITEVFKTIRKGYPVIVDLESRDSIINGRPRSPVPNARNES